MDTFSLHRGSLVLVFFFIVAHSPVMADPGDILLNIVNPYPHRYDYFGVSVAAAGADVVVGARWDGGNVPRSGPGRAYLFSGQTGQILTEFSPPTASSHNFGCSVSGWDNGVVIGASQDSAGGVGAAFAFDSRAGGTVQNLYHPSPSYGEGFGRRVAVAGNTIAVADQWDSTAADHAGAVYLFDKTTGQFTASFLNPYPGDGDQLGSTIAPVGEDFVVGWQNDTDQPSRAGGAYLFDGQTGALLQSFTNPSPQDFDYFGVTVAGLGTNVLVGGSRTGEAYLFDSATGDLLRTYENPGTETSFGRKVAAVGDDVLIAAGSRNAYLLDGDTGDLLLSIQISSGAITSMAARGNDIIIGNSAWNDDSGRIYVYEGVPEPATLSLLVDIRPGSDINPVNLTSQGVLPVAIYGSDQVDVEQIDLSSLVLEGTSPRAKGKSGKVGRFEDINGDLIVDLLLHFDMRDLDIDGTAEQFILSGVLLDGTALEGADSVRMVPLGDANADLKVDILDLTNLAANWGRSGGWHKGDFNDDGVVDIIDLTAVAANWGYDGTANGGIPEPASATLLAIGLSGLMWRRRRR